MMNEGLKKDEDVKNKKIDNNGPSLSDNKELNKKIKLTTIALIVITLLWIFVLNPFITFKINENDFSKSAQRYFETYPSELPTGERVGEVTLQQLYNKGIVDKDYYVPYKVLSKTTCSVTDSWVKVKRVDGNYKYYTYLKCGLLSSTIDHKGPKITLNDKEEITISLGDKFKDPGIKSIKDSRDGQIDIDKAIIKGKVNPNKIGTYKISYVAFDSLKNRTEKVRTVKVVQKLNETVKKETEKTGYYTGNNPNNYIYFSGMLFRIVNLDGDNVRIVAERDVANVNYDGIDKWLEYYYDHINENSKKLIVKNKYCKMNINSKDTNTTDCSNYTKKVNAYIPSIADVNRANSDTGNFLQPDTMSWVADDKDNNEAYLTRDIFYNEYVGEDFVAFPKKYNFGVRPMITIKGDILISKGKGTKNSPYEIGDFDRAKPSDKVNTRQSGEYLEINGRLWQIIEAEEDGTTKVIADFSLSKGTEYLLINYASDIKKNTYDINNKDNVGYKINNKSSEYIQTKYFVKHEVEVPIYKNDAKYQEEIKTEKIKTKIFAPNMYEMFTSDSESQSLKSYWTINSSQNKNLKYAVSDIGVVMYGEDVPSVNYGVRPTAYLSKDSIIVNGKGTRTNPYKIDK